jgi:hypothetical protein
MKQKALNFPHSQSIGGVVYVIPSLVIFLVKFFVEEHSLGDTGSNDTCLKFVSCRGAGKKDGHTDTQI